MTNGDLTRVARHTHWSHDWDIIVAGTFVGIGKASLLFYSR